MPLVKGSSPEVVSGNIRRELKSGRPRRQAIAIAMAVARARKKKAKGKREVNMLFWPKAGGGPCCGDEGCGTLTVRVNRCGSVRTAGVTVTMTLAGAAVSSGVTDSLGEVVLPYNATGTHTVVAARALYDSVTTTKALSCSAAPTPLAMGIAAAAAGPWVDCACTNYLPEMPCSGTSGRPNAELLPKTLYLTGPDGPVTLTFSGGAGGRVASWLTPGDVASRSSMCSPATP